MAGLNANSTLLWIAGMTLAALTGGSVVRLFAVRRAGPDVAKKRLDSLKTWWVLTVVVLAAASFGKSASVILFAAISAVALREFVALVYSGTQHRRLIPLAYALIPFNYFWIWLGWSDVVVVFLPLVTMAIFSIRLVVASQSDGFVRCVSGFHWGMLLLVYCLSHAALLFNLPQDSIPQAGVTGWFLFLIILTQINDISQALVGRRIGKHPITPVISPNKTWEGFVGGMAVTTALAVLLSEWLTTFGRSEAALAGLVIGVSGFFGDLNMSAVKRDLGVKDSSRLLPGQGGILDRIDSLTFTAPAFYYLVRIVLERSTV